MVHCGPTTVVQLLWVATVSPLQFHCCGLLWTTAMGAMVHYGLTSMFHYGSTTMAPMLWSTMVSLLWVYHGLPWSYYYAPTGMVCYGRLPWVTVISSMVCYGALWAAMICYWPTIMFHCGPTAMVHYNGSVQRVPWSAAVVHTLKVESPTGSNLRSSLVHS